MQATLLQAGPQESQENFPLGGPPESPRHKSLNTLPPGLSFPVIDGCVFSPSLFSFNSFLWEGRGIGRENFPFGAGVNSRTGL